MKKHRLRELFKYLSGRHLDSENFNSLEEDKRDIDEKVEKILKRLNENEEDGSLKNSNEGSEIVSLVNDLYKRYQSLYDRYDHLTGEVRKHDHDRDEDDESSSSSSSSESDSKPSSKHKKKTDKKRHDDMEIRNQELVNLVAELGLKEKNNVELENQLRNLTESVNASNQIIRTLTKEKEELMSENSVVLNKLQVIEKTVEQLKDENSKLTLEEKKKAEMEKEIRNLTESVNASNLRIRDMTKEKEDSVSENSDVLNKLRLVEKTVEELKDENSKVQVDYEGIKLELESAKRVEAEMNHKLESLNKEKDDLGLENLKALRKIQEGEKTIEDLRREAELLKEGKSKLWDERGGLKQELEALNQEMGDLNQRLRSIEEEKDALSLNNSDVLNRIEEMTEGFGNELGALKEENSKLWVENNNLKREHEFMISEKADLEEILTATSNEKNMLALENQAVLSKLEQSEKTIEEVNAEAERLKGDNFKLHESNENLNLGLEAANEQLADLSQKLRAAEEENSRLGSEILNRSQQAEKKMEEVENEIKCLREENLMLKMNQTESQTLISDLERRLKEGEEEVSNLLNKMEVVEKEASGQVNSRQLELDLLSTGKTELEAILTATSNEKNTLALENQAVLSKLEQAEKTIEEVNDEAERLKGDNFKLHESNKNLNLGLEAANEQSADLNQKLRAAEEENSRLVSEIFNRSQQAEKKMEEVENEIKCLKKENLMLKMNQTESQTLISDLERRLKEGEEEVSNLLNKMEVVEKEAFGQVNSQQLELDLLSKRKTELEAQMEIKNNEALENQIQMEKLNYELTTNISDLQVLLKEKDERLQAAEKKIEELEAELELLRTRKTELEGLIEVENNKASVKQIQFERLNNQLIGKISDYERMLEVAEHKSKDLHANYVELHRWYHDACDNLLTATVVKETEEETDWITQKLNDLKLGVDSLRNLNIESEITEASENQIHMEKLNCLASKIMQTMLNKQEENLDWLCANYKKLHRVRELCVNLHNSKMKIEEIAEESRRTIESKDSMIQKLQIEGKEQKKEIIIAGEEIDTLRMEIDKLEEKCVKLEEELQILEAERAEKAETANEKEVLLRSIEHEMGVLRKTGEDQNAEIEKLRKDIERMEVKVSLSLQRIRYTENELSDKVEKYQKLESQLSQLHEEHKQLKTCCMKLSEKVSLLENKLSEIKCAMEGAMETLSNGLRFLVQQFEENFERFQTQLSETSKEIGIAKTWAVRMTNEKSKMRSEINELIGRLEVVEGRESASQKTIGVLQVRLTEKKGEKETLMRSLNECEKRNGELEKKVKEREEEKREAIRQLCLLIEYHRGNCIHLEELLSTMMKRNQRRT